MRWKCRLLGCSVDPSCPGCERCGAYLYGDEWRDMPRWTWRAMYAWARLRALVVGNQCWHCGKTMKWTVRGQYFCSRQCEDDYLPF